MSKRIALLGGTFDPVHIGHMDLAANLLRELDVDEVRLLPSYQPPHKQTVVATDLQRLEMCRLAAQEDKRIVVDDTEIRIRSAYTVDTLMYLQQKEPGTQWLLTLGQDAALSFPYWKRSEEILQRAEIVISRRANCPRDADLERTVHFLQNCGGTVHILFSIPTKVSSSTVRQTAANQLSGLVPETVRNYIEKNGLYRKDK